MTTTRPRSASLAWLILLTSAGAPAQAQPDEGFVTPPLRPVVFAEQTADSETMPIDLPTALRLANASNPLIAIAQERFQQAYYRQRQAEVLWLPSLQTGPSYLRHDGLIQNSRAEVFPRDRWSIFAGGGASLRVDLADAFYQPLIARQLTQAQAAQARSVSFDVQLDVALTYLDLLDAHGRLAIIAETLTNAREMLKKAEAAQEAGTGKSPADAPRARAEVQLRTIERNNLEAVAGDIAARLARLLLLRPTVELVPAELAVIPVVLVPVELSVDQLVTIGVQNRPELEQGRALAQAALERWQQAKHAPLIPRLEVGYYGGAFSGGPNGDIYRSGGRGDGFVQAVWELRNFGLGDLARARERQSQYTESNLFVVDIQARIGAEITTAARYVHARRKSLAEAQKAVTEARKTWRILVESSFGLAGKERRYDPLEPLIAVQQLQAARNQYLTEVTGFNKAQFRLYTALGQPALSALPQPGLVLISLPVLPTGKDDEPKK